MNVYVPNFLLVFSPVKFEDYLFTETGRLPDSTLYSTLAGDDFKTFTYIPQNEWERLYFPDLAQKVYGELTPFALKDVQCRFGHDESFPGHENVLEIHVDWSKV